MFSFIEKFSKIYSHFPISIIFGEFEVIYCNFCKKEIFGDVISLMVIRKMFSFIEKSVSAIFGEYGVNFL